MYKIQAYKLLDSKLNLSKELSLDNKFKANKAWAGLTVKNDFVLFHDEDGSVTVGIKNMEVADAYMKYVTGEKCQ